MSNGHTAVDLHRPETITINPLPFDASTGTILLEPGRLYLGAVNEAFEADYVDIAGIRHPVTMQYEGRSTCGRLGIASHITAGFADHGFRGALTLELTVVLPVKLLPGMRIGQVYFTTLPSEAGAVRYDGAYSGSQHYDGPVPPTLGQGRF